MQAPTPRSWFIHNLRQNTTYIYAILFYAQVITLLSIPYPAICAPRAAVFMAAFCMYPVNCICFELYSYTKSSKNDKNIHHGLSKFKLS